MNVRDSIVGYLQSIPLAIDAAKLNSMIHALEFAQPRADAITRRPTPAPRRGGGRTATIPLTGFLDMKASPALKYFGGTSLQDFGEMFDRLVDDPTIDRIVVEADTPGGSTYFCEEMADRIFRARRSKQVDGIANPMAASAGYWLLSQTDRVAVTPSGAVGSIGCYCLHLDATDAYAKAGLKPTIIRFGRLKAAGSPHEPLSPDARERFQREVNDYGNRFVSHIARARDVRPETIRASWGEGMMMSSREARDKGAVDTIVTLDEFIHQGGTKSGKSANRIAAMSAGLSLDAARAVLAGLE